MIRRQHDGQVTGRASRQNSIVLALLPPGLPKHPIGTFAFIGAYGVLFVLAWFAIYRFIFMARGPVTP
jgi:hypothetical protein